ncbi:MAG: alpha-glucan family phosphorylase [Candidatus Hermodarchaeota archaeon]
MGILDKLPKRIDRLGELAYNLWWSWTPEGDLVFRNLDRPLWYTTDHNPVKMLLTISEQRLNTQAKNPRFLKLYDTAIIRYDREMNQVRTWWSQEFPDQKDQTVAYMSAEFGLHRSIPIYSGGLGILSGDHCKETSDLGIPFVAIGFLYQQGYFHQRVPLDGWQQADYIEVNYDEIAIQPVKQGEKQLIVPIEINNHLISVKLWQILVGRTKVYLMDTNTEENAPWDRELTHRLYGGDSEMRLRQEIVLGIGGVRVLRRLGYEPTVWHLNEGHTSFSVVERISEEIEKGQSLEYAKQKIRNQTVFTTHTPVPAGHDAFTFDLIDTYFSEFCKAIDLSQKEFLSLGEWNNMFNMTVLGMRNSLLRNAVSKLNAKVVAEMWASFWREFQTSPEKKHIIPVTNGVHVATWISWLVDELFRKYIDPKWKQKHDDPRLWEKLDEIPDLELWHCHLECKARLFQMLRELTRRNRTNQIWEPEKALISGAMLDPNVLTIGFARRFTTYKRSTLIFSDYERIKRIITDPYRPVQIIFAGKAHPADDLAKFLLQDIINYCRNVEFQHRIAFIENYDMRIAKTLLQGVDVWLNTPLRPMEASGTSGMKAAMNLVPNLSILDGWWAEAYDGTNGWAIGRGEKFSDRGKQDSHDIQALYETLETEVIPMFYTRDPEDLPHAWLDVIRNSVRVAMSQFSSRRMLKEYAKNLYIPAMEFSKTFGK